MIETAIDPSTAFRGMSLLVAAWVCVSGLEQIAMYDAANPQALMNWRIMKSYYRENPLSPLLEPVLSPTGYRLLLYARVGLGVVLAGLAVLDQLHPAVFLLLFLTDAMIFYRNVVGLSGAYHMVLVVNATLFLTTLFPEGSLVYQAALVFMGIQGVLAYTVSGWLKLSEGEWRDGSGLKGVFATDTFGEERIYELMSEYPALSLVGSWSVIVFECAYLFVVVVPPEWTVAFFATALLFHLFNALFMGLNGFLVIFPASYYPVYYTNLWVHRVLL